MGFRELNRPKGREGGDMDQKEYEETVKRWTGSETAQCEPSPQEKEAAWVAAKPFVDESFRRMRGEVPGQAELLESLMRFQTELARKLDQGLRDLGDRLTKIEQASSADPMLDSTARIRAAVGTGSYPNQFADLGGIALPGPPLNGRNMAQSSPRQPALSERIACLEVELSILKAEHFNTANNQQERIALLERECLALDQSKR